MTSVLVTFNDFSMRGMCILAIVSKIFPMIIWRVKATYGLWADAKIGGVPQCYLDGVCLIYISIDIKKLNGQNKNFTTELSMDT